MLCVQILRQSLREPSSHELDACKREGATAAQQSVIREASKTPLETASTEPSLGEDAKFKARPSIFESEHTIVKSSNDRSKSSQKGFGEHLVRMICNTSFRGLWQDLRNRSRCKSMYGKISVTDLDAKSVSQVAGQDLRARSMQVPFVKVSVKDRAQAPLDSFCAKAAVQDPCKAS